MTPPIRMVSVPVEPTEAMWEAASKAWHDHDRPYTFDCTKAAFRAMLTAAPVREEGGAVREALKEAAAALSYIGSNEFKVQPDDAGPGGSGRKSWSRTMVETVSFAKRKGAEAKSALATREEAPAEAGESPLVDWFSRFVEAHQEGCGPDTDALIACLDRVRDSYRAQPQAREEAQPVAVKALVDAALTYISGVGYAPGFGPVGKLHEAAWAVKRSPLYTTPPAPEAEKLRVAVEAEQLGTALADLVSWFTKPVQGERGLVWVIPAGQQGADDAVAQALAALQQEGRPDA